jgi:hypothetical protein
LLGTTINAATVVTGSLIGVSVGARLPERIRTSVLHGLGIITTVIGLQMALETKHLLVVLGAILSGAILGELLRLTEALERVGQFLHRFLSKGSTTHFGEGFITASLVFCVGPMTILGSIQDGLSGNYQLLAVKSVLDGFAAIAFSASLGWGVGCAALTIIVVQGGITVFAGIFDRFLTEPMIVEMTASGGIIIVGIGLKLLNIADIRLASFLPALIIAPLLVKYLPVVKSLF